MEQRLLTESLRRCPLCAYLDGDWSEKQIQIAHINRNPGDNRFENLAPLCLPHHDRYDSKTSQSKGYTPQELRHHLANLYLAVRAGRVPAAPASSPPAVEDAVGEATSTAWLARQRRASLAHFGPDDAPLAMEAFASIRPAVDVDQARLLHAADAAKLPSCGWPIGVLDRTQKEFRPKPEPDGISLFVKSLGYLDYWALNTTGAFYLRRKLFEAANHGLEIWFDVRVKRAAELIMYLSRLYAGLQARQSARVEVEVRYFGIDEATLAASAQFPSFQRRDAPETRSVNASVSTSVQRLVPEVAAHARSLTAPLFLLFDYFSVDDARARDLAEYVRDGGRI